MALTRAQRIEALAAGIANVLRAYPSQHGAHLASKILSVEEDMGEAEWLAEAERRLAAVSPLPAPRRLD